MMRSVWRILWRAALLAGIWGLCGAGLGLASTPGGELAALERVDAEAPGGELGAALDPVAEASDADHSRELAEVVAPGLASARANIPLPGVLQVGDVTNCGPTAAAILLSAYEGFGHRDQHEALRDAIGVWTWEEFPARRLRVAGHDAGMTTPAMMRAALGHFGAPVRFEEPMHPWIPGELWGLIALHRALEEGRPVVALVQVSTLWNVRSPGLHWIVIRGLDRGEVVYNDPADGTRSRVSLGRFWEAWRLHDVYRRMPLVGAFRALIPDTPVPQRSFALDAPPPARALAR